MNQLYGEDDPRDMPLYPVVEAARYLQVPDFVLRKWLKWELKFVEGEKQPQPVEPLILRPLSTTPDLSFFNLVEAHLLQVLRMFKGDHRETMQAALSKLAKQLGHSHPLVHNDFSSKGSDLLVNAFGQSLGLSRSKRLAMATRLKVLISRIEWGQYGKASRLFPMVEMGPEAESSRPLMIDPTVSFGRPVIAGTGIPTSVINELYEAGDSIEVIAKDYDSTPEQIASAIYFESQDKAA